MLSIQILILLILSFGAKCAWGCSDPGCEPSWSLDSKEYDDCNNLPLLTPGNDTRVNLSLLMADGGFASLQSAPGKSAELSLNDVYGKVPFSFEIFYDDILRPSRKAVDTPSKGSSPAEIDINSANIQAATAGFFEALDRNRNLTGEERQRLVARRRKMASDWLSDKSAAPDSAVAVPADKEIDAGGSRGYQDFSLYLDAADSFYKELYVVAIKYFTALTDSSDPWLRETSRYMVGRAELRRSLSEAFDEYGCYDHTRLDKQAVQVAEEKFRSYLKEYPSGRYAVSARGLFRRIHWISGDSQKLAEDYDSLLKDPISTQNNAALTNLLQEVDNKLLSYSRSATIKTPLFLAITDLSRMRADSAKPLDLKDLQAQEPLFSGHRALYEYLLAAHSFYVQKDVLRTMSLLSGDIPVKMTYLDFSRLFLRGLALEASKDYDGARNFWLKLLAAARQPLQSEAVQLALAKNYERSSMLMDKAFATDSPITDPTIRIRLLRDVASPSLLRRVINEKSTPARVREFALYILLYKDLFQGHYKEYISDYRLLPKDVASYTGANTDSGFAQPHLSLFTWTGEKSDYRKNRLTTLDIAGLLAQNPRDPLGLVSLADFTDVSGFFEIASAKRSQFPGNLFTKGDAYKIIIADNTAPQEITAYALYRAIKCYASSGVNHCGGKDEPVSVRRSWFLLLKSRYNNSVWAGKLKYYW